MPKCPDSKGNLRYRQLERITKGVANHRRIEILDLLHREPQLSVMEISEKLGVNFKTISEHVRRLTHAGLVLKRSEGAAVRHALSPQGFLILKFLRTLE
ncbi:MAG: winged helix-turn-helix transcriptional regulator [Candidatus Liptonbacteria bacterium]|nr:winged helix-turn-helix transcriptional regulator [Candidatus Liptonbacteria bacterium]